jgi:hypothetical protein
VGRHTQRKYIHREEEMFLRYIHMVQRWYANLLWGQSASWIDCMQDNFFDLWPEKILRIDSYEITPSLVTSYLSYWGMIGEACNMPLDLCHSHSSISLFKSCSHRTYPISQVVYSLWQGCEVVNWWWGHFEYGEPPCSISPTPHRSIIVIQTKKKVISLRGNRQSATSVRM